MVDNTYAPHYDTSRSALTFCNQNSTFNAHPPRCATLRTRTFGHPALGARRSRSALGMTRTAEARSTAMRYTKETRVGTFHRSVGYDAYSLRRLCCRMYNVSSRRCCATAATKTSPWPTSKRSFQRYLMVTWRIRITSVYHWEVTFICQRTRGHALSSPIRLTRTVAAGSSSTR